MSNMMWLFSSFPFCLYPNAAGMANTAPIPGGCGCSWPCLSLIILNVAGMSVFEPIAIVTYRLRWLQKYLPS